MKRSRNVGGTGKFGNRRSVREYFRRARGGSENADPFPFEKVGERRQHDFFVGNHGERNLFPLGGFGYGQGVGRVAFEGEIKPSAAISGNKNAAPPDFPTAFATANARAPSPATRIFNV